MTTRNIVLTNEPQLITSKAAYIQANGGVFKFKFSQDTPNDMENSHTDTKLYQDGSLGPVYAWKNVFQDVTLTVSEAI